MRTSSQQQRQVRKTRNRVVVRRNDCVTVLRLLRPSCTRILVRTRYMVSIILARVPFFVSHTYFLPKVCILGVKIMYQVLADVQWLGPVYVSLYRYHTIAWYIPVHTGMYSESPSRSHTTGRARARDSRWSKRVLIFGTDWSCLSHSSVFPVPGISLKLTFPLTQHPHCR